jgi:hypothetical protein
MTPKRESGDITVAWSGELITLVKAGIHPSSEQARLDRPQEQQR